MYKLLKKDEALEVEIQTLLNDTYKILSKLPERKQPQDGIELDIGRLEIAYEEIDKAARKM